MHCKNRLQPRRVSMKNHLRCVEKKAKFGHSHRIKSYLFNVKMFRFERDIGCAQCTKKKLPVHRYYDRRL